MNSRVIRSLKRLAQISVLLKISAVLTLIGLALMVWSLAQPTPMPVILAMSLGQVVGILAFLLFGYAVLLDQLRKQRDKVAAEVKPAPAPSAEEPPTYQAAVPGAPPGADTSSGAPRGSSVARREAPP